MTVGYRGGIMPAYTDIVVRAALQNVQTLVQQAFASSGFQVTWGSAQNGKAEKGSRAANFALGALSQYYAIDFQIYPAAEGATLRLIRSNSGAMGGLIGMARVKKQFNTLAETLASWFRQQGTFVAMNEGKA